MPNLDAPQSFGARDPKGMLAHITALPQQCTRAWEEIQSLALPDEYRQVQQIVVLGMGGSAIGGDLLRGLLKEESPVPIVVHREYGLPSFVGAQTLVIASSYSGNTHETLLSFDEARQRGARLLSITTGGELARRTSQQGLPLHQYDYKAQPRAALGYSLLSLLGVLQHLGFVQDKSADVAEAVEVMQRWQSEIHEFVPTCANAAKSLAQRLYGRLPVVYGAGHLSAVARRWKCQFNENAKAWAFCDVLPELLHNTVAGYACPKGLQESVHVLMLRCASDYPRQQKSFDVVTELLQREGFAWSDVEARGQSKLAQALSVVLFGDYVSYYLAMLYDVDPWEIENIQWLKGRLSAL